MLHRSTVQLLRFPFSLFLMPVYLFAVSQVTEPDWKNALLVFVILHVFVYPASNGYNSYMDRDEGSIGGVKNPKQPTKQLFRISVAMDVIAVASAFGISYVFAAGITAYILASRAYSFRGIRLKKYPVTGYLTVTLFQGAVTFFLVYHGVHPANTLHVPLIAACSSSLLIGGFYPLTQVYQHDADRRDGVITISARLGYRGTFVFSAFVYTIAFGLLALHFLSTGAARDLLILQVLMLPVLVYFFVWASKVWKNKAAANFTNTMRMNLIASLCTSAAFIIIIILKALE